MSGQHARDDRMTVSFAVDGEGRILGVKADLVEDVGSFAAAGSSAIGFVGLLFPGPYKIPKVGFSATAVYTNTCGRCSYRGPWMMETLAREQMMDVIARRIGLDPLEFRRINVVNEADLPFTTAAGLVYDAVSIGASLEQAAAMIDYEAFRVEQAAARDQGRLLGVGFGLYVEPSGIAMGSLASEAAIVSIGVNGAGAGAHEQRQPRPERRDDRRPGGGRPARCGHRRRHGHPGRHRVGTPSGPGTGGSRSAVLVSGAADRGRRPGPRRRCWRSPPMRSRRRPRTSRSSAGRISVVGTPSKGMSITEVAHIAYISPTSLPPGMPMGLEEQARYTPSSPIHVVELVPRLRLRGGRRAPVRSPSCATSSARTAG